MMDTYSSIDSPWSVTALSMASLASSTIFSFSASKAGYNGLTLPSCTARGRSGRKLELL
jgi:hypothetical protein